MKPINQRLSATSLTDVLTGEDHTEIDLAATEAEVPALGGGASPVH
jgi:hypothetical protein